MSLKVIVPNGRTEITVNGLHQWDYGRTIEIQADSLSDLADVEVHFACTGMETAVVRNCAVLGGKATAAVPDICLEQTTPIVAWVYAIGETTGATILTITLPIIPRTQPQLSPTVPETVSDKYTEAIAAMNELVAECEQTVQNAADEVEDRIADNLYKSEWTAKNAENADKANHALVLTPGEINTTDTSRMYCPIVFPGMYVVVFNTKHTNLASALIAIPDLGGDVYGTDTALGQPVYEAIYGRMSVYIDAEPLPIVAVYKIAEL